MSKWTILIVILMMVGAYSLIVSWDMAYMNSLPFSSQDNYFLVFAIGWVTLIAGGGIAIYFLEEEVV